MSVFKGFNIKYPEYTVICPHTGNQFNVRSMTVSETGKLRTSLSTEVASAKLINKMIWEATSEKPDHIKTYDDFKKNVTLKDREALIYGIYQSSFGDKVDYNVTCVKCGNVDSIKLILSNAFKMNAYPLSDAVIESYKLAKVANDAEPDAEIEEEIKRRIKKVANDAEPDAEIEEEIKRRIKKEAMASIDKQKDISQPDDDMFEQQMKKKKRLDEIDKNIKEDQEQKDASDEVEEENKEETILTKVVEIKLPISKIHAFIKQPTIFDEEDAIDNVPYAKGSQLELLNDAIFIDRFEVYSPKQNKPIQVVDRIDDILYGYQSLPPMDKIELNKAIYENFTKYGIELSFNKNCSACGKENSFGLDLFYQFLRMVNQI